MKRKVSAAAPGHFEPVMEVTFLPGCEYCGAVHPLAMKPPLDIDTCPGCGEQVAKPGAPEIVPAVLTGFDPIRLIGQGFTAFGQWLFKLAKRL